MVVLQVLQVVVLRVLQEMVLRVHQEVVWENPRLSLSLSWFHLKGMAQRERNQVMESSPLLFISDKLFGQSLPPEPTSQLPASFLLTSFCSTPFYPHTSDTESSFFALEKKSVFNLAKKEGAGYLRIARGCLQGQKKSKGINLVSYAFSYILGPDKTCQM